LFLGPKTQYRNTHSVPCCCQGLLLLFEELQLLLQHKSWKQRFGGAKRRKGKESDGGNASQVRKEPKE
jgi:hypothetical protein